MIDLPVGRPRPGDQRAFVHKKFLGAVGSIAGIAQRVGIPGAGFVSTAARTLASVGGTRTITLPRTETARVTLASQEEKRLGQNVKFSTGGFSPQVPASGRCADPALIRAPDGHCVAPGSGHFQSHFGGVVGGPGVPVGDAVMGRFGAALTPGSMIIDRAVCLRGMQLAIDGLCYNKSQISNKQRMWPAGRKPLLSGGDMRAISIAARAGRRLEGATKRLQRLGMMKKATPRRLAPHQHARLLPAVSVT